MHPEKAFTTTRFAFAACLVALAVWLGGCNSSDLSNLLGASSSSSSPSGVASAAGIWMGSDSATGLAITGFVDSSGQADFILSNGIQFTGAVQVAGTSVAMSLDGYPQFGAQFSDGSTYGVGTFNGTVSSGSALTGTLSFTTTGDTATTSTWTLTFDSLYDMASALTTLNGTYTESTSAVSQGLDPLSGVNVSISSSGVLSGENTANGCVLNGTISNSNASYDVFQVSFTYANCTGSYSALDGVQFTGLADYNPNESPSGIVIGVTGQSSSGAYYGDVLALSGT